MLLLRHLLFIWICLVTCSCLSWWFCFCPFFFKYVDSWFHILHATVANFQNFSVWNYGIRNGRTQNLTNGKNLTKIKKLEQFFYVQNSIRQLQHHVKEAVTCFLHLAVLTLSHHQQVTSEKPRLSESGMSSNRSSWRSSEVNDYQDLFHITITLHQPK